MVRRTRILAFVGAACVVAASVTCSKPVEKPPEKAPELKALSEAEATELRNRAESLDPVGEASVRRIEVDNTVTVVCTQTFALRMAGGRPGGGVIDACGGSCKLKPGGTFATCKTSGCLSNGRSCSPLVCEGGCELATACKAEKSVGAVMW